MAYTLELALVDYLPILFTAVGLWFVARLALQTGASQGQMAMLGGGLVVVGGLLKATWKLIMAATAGATDIRWMDNGLFIGMAPGFVLVGAGVWYAMRAAQGRRLGRVWPAPLVIIISMFGASLFLGWRNPDTPAWERVLLGVMVLASTVTSILLTIFAFRQKLPASGGLFILNLAGVYVLNGLARLENQTIALQWVEEIINTAAWLAFAVAGWKLHAYVRAAFGAGAGGPAAAAPA
jgi:hypothetical protein